MKKSTVIEGLQERFPGIKYIQDAAEWGGERYKEGIHLGNIAEGGEIDDVPGADYDAWVTDPSEEIYILGIHRKMVEALEEYGYFAEWNDPGTLIAWPV